MSRTKHTDPKTIRAARRIRALRDGRGVGDLSRRRELGREREEAGVTPDESKGMARHSVRAVGKSPNTSVTNRGAQRTDPPYQKGWSKVRITVRTPRTGFHHPAGEQDVLEMLKAIGLVAFYGLRSVDFARSPTNGSISAPVFGRYCVPGRIILFEQPMPPWRLPGLVEDDVVRRFWRAGAVLTLLTDVGATLVDWPRDTLRRFMLEEVLLHELGHHVLQQHKGKRPVRIARTRDHEAFAARFAEKQRAALKKGSCH